MKAQWLRIPLPLAPKAEWIPAAACLILAIVTLCCQEPFQALLSVVLGIFLILWSYAHPPFYSPVRLWLGPCLAASVLLTTAFLAPAEDLYHVGLAAVGWGVFSSFVFLGLYHWLGPRHSTKPWLWSLVSLFCMTLIILLAKTCTFTAFLYVGGIMVFTAAALFLLMKPEKNPSPAFLSRGHPSSAFFSNPWHAYFFAVALSVLYLWVIFKSAWVADDAYITFRVIDNFWNGFGMTWNPQQRVQVFTHPLWLLILTGLGFFTREYYFTSVLLGIALSLGAFWIMVLKIGKTPAHAFAAAVMLTFSKAYMDYATSGLENSLSYFLLAFFFLLYLEARQTPKYFFWLSLLAALGMLVRMDHALLFLPALIQRFFALARQNRRQAIWLLVLGSSPFIAWELFAVVYYGFPFPNTAYAKLNTGLAGLVLCRQGFYYLLNSLIYDPVTLLVICLGGLLPFLLDSEPEKKIISLATALYMAYVIKIGGCFMSGRFLAAPFLLAVCLLLTTVRFTPGAFSILLALALLLSPISPDNPWRSDARYENRTFDTHKIADERGFYFQITGLLHSLTRTPSDHKEVFSRGMQ
ncbi:hypothetical protein JW933_02545, partial [candidate division FCPU426 bacterium]|nr:hypothetical protein [candidate division FCPU426 bacterium]